MSDRAQGLIKKGTAGPFPPIRGVIDAFYKEDGHCRLVGKTDVGKNISIDVERGEIRADVGGLLLLVKGEYARASDNRFAVYSHRDGVYAGLDIGPDSRFELKFVYKR